LLLRRVLKGPLFKKNGKKEGGEGGRERERRE